MVDIKPLLNEKLDAENRRRLAALNNPRLNDFLADAVELAEPDSVFICTDSAEDAAYIRRLAVENGEEISLTVPAHTCHFDGYNDQARDKANTKYLVDGGGGGFLNCADKTAGTNEVRGFLKNSMAGRRMLVCFFCLGPVGSDFSILCAQITDSAYVAHSEQILYRPGYEQFKKLGGSADFFRLLHSQGELEGAVSKNVQNRRVYIDLDDEIVYSANTQYGGNTIGLKKLSLRLAIKRAATEGWLAEHMFIMGMHGPNGRVTYFTGAFPSACGKTSTSMIPGQTIVGDDIAYLRRKNGQIRCVNVEKGIFGIIRDVNAEDDPIIYKALTSNIEVIFSNILIDSQLKPYWLGMGSELPNEGRNHSGNWHTGKTDSNDREITASHKNARYCLAIPDLDNCDPRLDDPDGVEVGGIVYGGRDSDTWVPVERAYNWTEGIILKGASLESETTAATLGAEGVRSFNLMSNLDFLSIPLGRYIRMNLDFAGGLEKPPAIFSVNYFLRDRGGRYLTGMADKKIWMLWAELSANGDVEGIRTPTGLIPRYEDLARLFAEHLGTDYRREQYVTQFTFRAPENLAKLDRVEIIYREKADEVPDIVFETFAIARKRIAAAAKEHGEYIRPGG